MSPSPRLYPRFRLARSPSSPTCSRRARRRRPTSRTSSSRTSSGRTPRRPGRRGVRVTRCRRSASGSATTSRSGSPTGPDIVRAWFGANAVGAVYAPLNLAAKGSYLEHTLKVADAKVLVAHHQLAERLVGIDAPSLEQVVIVGGQPPAGLAVARGDPRRAAGRRLGRAADPGAARSSRGTTSASSTRRGRPGRRRAFVPRTPRSGTTRTASSSRTSTSSDRYLNALPMFHTAGTGITYSMLRAGGSVALSGGFSASRFWDDVRRFEATITIAIHGMVTFMLDQPVKPDDADNPLKTVYMGPLSRHKEFAERFGVRIYTAYGMTEVPVPITSALDPDDERSCGVNAAPEQYELRLVDENDVRVPPEHAGRARSRRHAHPWTINSGYKGMPEATAEAWRNGWFHTGDQFTRDEDGNFYFLDRIKDVIRRRGENISSFEVETEVMSHPLVKEAAAVAVQNPDIAESAGDEEVKVVVVLEEGADPRSGRADGVPRGPHARVLGSAVHRVPPGAAAHGVAQAEEGRPARGRDHGGHLGPGEGRRQAQAGSPDLSLLEADERRGAARRRPVRLLRSHLSFPLRDHCPACGGAVERELLPSHGTLWTWTTQGFEPKPPYVAGRRVRAVRRRVRRVPRPPPRRREAGGGRPGAARDRHDDARRGDRARRPTRPTRSHPHERDRDRRRRDPSVRPARGGLRVCRWACTRCGKRSPTRASRGATCSSPTAAARTAATPTRWSPTSARPASRSPT